jgi:hypothetical protein
MDFPVVQAARLHEARDFLCRRAARTTILSVYAFQQECPQETREAGGTENPVQHQVTPANGFFLKIFDEPLTPGRCPSYITLCVAESTRSKVAGDSGFFHRSLTTR